jgi:hypothetical protein
MSPFFVGISNFGGDGRTVEKTLPAQNEFRGMLLRVGYSGGRWEGWIQWDTVGYSGGIQCWDTVGYSVGIQWDTVGYRGKQGDTVVGAVGYSGIHLL